MAEYQARSKAFPLASKPSTAFSTHSSAASATSAGTARSGGSRLLFGEIDTSSDRSSESFASVCSLVLSDSSTFLKFWLAEECRETFIKNVARDDLFNLRLVCHDFSVRAAPALFDQLSITFRPRTFTRPARLAALDRIGYHVKTLQFNLPRTAESFLPPLIHPETGEELNFPYTPQLETSRHPKYNDTNTTELLTQQYPPLFHAATNVPAFIHAFASLPALSHLHIDCPNYTLSSTPSRRSIIDFALISLRIAIERNPLPALTALTLSNLHPNAILYFSPLLGYAATPTSAKTWSRITSLSISMHPPPPLAQTTAEHPNHLILLQTYLRNFRAGLKQFSFTWLGETKGPLPFPVASAAPPHKPNSNHFPLLHSLHLTNTTTTATALATFISTHKPSLQNLKFTNVALETGKWEQALEPITRKHRTASAGSDKNVAKRSEHQNAWLFPEVLGHIPIMLSPSTASPTSGRAVETGSRVSFARGAVCSASSSSSLPSGGPDLDRGLGCHPALAPLGEFGRYSRRTV
ncbi:hypothetical protein MBLNU230_g8567t1 [Neophaeotheca triangularis]